MYADESNSTGENLLDPAQPVFCVAGVCIDDDLARQVVDDVRAALPPGHGEAKYTTLSKTSKGRSILLSAFDSLAGETIRACVAHKRFMVTAKMVDVLVVEFAHENGYNMYADGSAVALANMLHAFGRVMGDPASFDRMLQTFVDAARKRTRASADDLFASIDAYQSTTQPEYSELSSVLQLTRAQADDTFAAIASGRVQDLLDPALPSLADLCGGMGEIVGDFVLVHDESKIVTRNVQLLLNMDGLPDPARPGQRLGRLPLVDIRFSDSTAVAQLQIADWAAGAVRQYATSLVREEPDPFAEKLKDLVESWLLGGIWPDLSVVGNPRRID
ncbi:DUF3800 domain-containing protein [Streptomyces sp. NPDC058623]|uniref:DUF3800 domain-containing protein n=1 Tax=Streptomyces sp. NPDC058623 TaxID=3346563 RepID=UPI00364B2FBD